MAGDDKHRRNIKENNESLNIQNSLVFYFVGTSPICKYCDIFARIGKMVTVSQ